MRIPLRAIHVGTNNKQQNVATMFPCEAVIAASIKASAQVIPKTIVRNQLRGFCFGFQFEYATTFPLSNTDKRTNTLMNPLIFARL